MQHILKMPLNLILTLKIDVVCISTECADFLELATEIVYECCAKTSLLNERTDDVWSIGRGVCIVNGLLRREALEGWAPIMPFSKSTTAGALVGTHSKR